MLKSSQLHSLRHLYCWVIILAVACAFTVGREAHAVSLPALVSIADLQTRMDASTRPVLVRGSVTLIGRETVIQDRTGALHLRIASGSIAPALGDEIEAEGVLERNMPPLFLVSSVRRLWGGSYPLPLALDPDNAAVGDLNGLLVQLDGRLLSVSRNADHELRLTIQGGNQIFDAVFPSGSEPNSTWQELSRLRLTGVLAVQATAASPVLPEASFQLMLRTEDDVNLLMPPPWWTGEHISWIALALLGCVFLLYVRIQQVRAAKLKAISEERGRIARDIHDTLAQAFAGITLQLESALLLQAIDVEASRRVLRLGLQMVRHSRAESHSAIRVLRCLSRNESLHELFAKTIADCGNDLPVVLQQHTVGLPYPLSYTLTNNLFHIGMEAFANALQHAAANRIFLSVEYQPRNVIVSVTDNGRGFDPLCAPGATHGHFGLTGMRERAQAIAAEIIIQSRIDSGTSVRVVAGRRE